MRRSSIHSTCLNPWPGCPAQLVFHTLSPPTQKNRDAPTFMYLHPWPQRVVQPRWIYIRPRPDEIPGSVGVLRGSLTFSLTARESAFGAQVTGRCMCPPWVDSAVADDSSSTQNYETLNIHAPGPVARRVRNLCSMQEALQLKYMGNIAATGPFDRHRVQPSCVPRSGSPPTQKSETLSIVRSTDPWPGACPVTCSTQGLNKKKRRQHCCDGPATRRVFSPSFVPRSVPSMPKHMRQLNIHAPGPIIPARVNQLVFHAGNLQLKNI
jgi:hypothetical protein